MGMLDDYFDGRTFDDIKIQDILAMDLMERSGRIVYPIYRNRLFGFLYRKTKLKCFLKGWQCGGKFYPPDTPIKNIIQQEPAKYVEFKRWTE